RTHAPAACERTAERPGERQRVGRDFAQRRALRGREPAEGVVDDHQSLVERAVGTARTVVLFGGLDSGKTTTGTMMVRAALAAGRSPAYLDADPGQKSVGPPTTVGMKMISSEDDLLPDALCSADALAFVGATTPQGNL